MTSFARSFLKNALSWLTSNLASRLTATILFIALTNRVSLAEAGAYRLGITFTTLLIPLAGWGLEQLIIRDVAQDATRASRYLSNFLWLRLCVTLLSWVLLLILVTLIGYVPLTRQVVLIMGLTIISDGVGGLLQATYVTFGRTVTMLYVAVVVNALRLGLGLAALFSGRGAMGLAVIFVGASLLGLFLNLFLVHRRLVPLSPGVDLGFWRQQLRLAFPFFVIDASWAIEFQVGQVLLSIYRDESAVGLYGAAFTILSVFTLMAQAFMFTVFPIMSRVYQTSQERLALVYDKSCHYLLLFSLPLIVSVSLLSETLLGLVYPAAFQAATLTLSVLVWSSLFTFLNVPNSRLVVITDRQGQQAKYMVASAAINVALNVLLIPGWGIEGVAVARVISSCAFFIPNYLFVYRHIHKLNLARLSVRPFLAAGGMAAAILLLQAEHPWLALGGGGLVYLSIVILLQAVTLQDVRFFRQMLGGLTGSR